MSTWPDCQSGKCPGSRHFSLPSFRVLEEEADAARLQEKAELLAPDIQEAIIHGRQAKGMRLEELMGAMPAEWEEQRHFCSRR